MPNRSPATLSCPMSNQSPDNPGYACSNTFNDDVLHTVSDIDERQSNSQIEDWFDGAIFTFDGAVALCEAQPDILVDLPLEFSDIGPQSLAPTLSLDQHSCTEAGFLGTLYNPTAEDNVYGDTPYQRQSSGFSACDNIIFDHLDGNHFLNQYAVTRTSSSIQSPRTRPDATQIMETPVLEHHASPKNACAVSQRTLHRCESRIAKAQFPFEHTICGQTFARSKDLKRHKSTVHREDDDPVYLCRCGKDDPRKDNHSRHVGVCVKPSCLGSYVCKCSHPSEERHDHLEHVKSCSPGKRSRRRPNAS